MSLQVISYSKLKAHDEAEIKTLVETTCSSGAFFLDLSSETESLAHLNPVLDAQRTFFLDNDLEAKLAYSDEQDGRGYDNFEAVCVQRIKLSRQQQKEGTLPLPPVLEAVSFQLDEIASFTDRVLNRLSTIIYNSHHLLGSPEVFKREIILDSETTNKHPEISNLCLGLATAPKMTELMPAHLDEDLLTLTFYDEPFLEVQDRHTQEWKLVNTCVDGVGNHMPIVNVGETFQEVSGGKLHAPFHRVKMTEREIDLVMYDFCEGV
ncbi:hypothetical protein QBC37DRAFT_367780 [Rhypophila decipiens]|uniref:Isopenicillin N synthase-like Fe(2+) 2OG dioxygenase domain-containing protein n=1 Tax=Rhypophila decipiens TaxID=261697 RepID=A0AAN7BD80_9PEZI|nr:hypothetical protein QBC37DRAFT_367780 [Rhypophila decipiens]